ncbi:MAG: NAD(+)/NADH kinase [Chloroflexota bacterium]|nr:MAG: NAD(+)/NADH kinase [Chloroflexota bacterium]
MTETGAAMSSVSELASGLRNGTKRVVLLANRHSADAERLGPILTKWLAARGIAVVTDGAFEADIGLVLSLGGDGLMMRAARRYPDVPVLGINFGHFGFLTAAEAEEWEQSLARVIAGDFHVRVGPTLVTRLHRRESGRDEDLGWAVNDVVVHGGLRFIQPSLFIDRQYVNDYPGDGMVISTPAGSTAYCMAAGGPVLLSGVGGLAIVPISCHSPIRVSLVVPEDVEIGIRLDGRHPANLIIDGESDQQRTIEPGDTVSVRKGPVEFRHVSFRSFDWFAAFQSKFNYQIRRADQAAPEPFPSG